MLRSMKELFWGVSAPSLRPALLEAARAEVVEEMKERAEKLGLAESEVEAIVPSAMSVEIANVTVTAAPDQFGQRTFTGPGGTTFLSIPEISQLPEAAGTCYASLRGIWTFQTNTQMWAIAPVANGATTGGTCN